MDRLWKHPNFIENIVFMSDITKYFVRLDIWHYVKPINVTKTTLAYNKFLKEI